MIEIKSREKLGLPPKKTDESLLDQVEIDGDEMESSELVDVIDEPTNDVFDQCGTMTGTRHERVNTDMSDDLSNEPSHILLQNRLKQIKRVQMKSLPQQIREDNRRMPSSALNLKTGISPKNQRFESLKVPQK